jgi:hypothetical protein
MGNLEKSFQKAIAATKRATSHKKVIVQRGQYLNEPAEYRAIQESSTGVQASKWTTKTKAETLARNMRVADRSSKKAKKPRALKSFEEATSLAPEVMADSVVQGAEDLTKIDLGETERVYSDRLAADARRIYASNETFRKKLIRDSGRDTLYAFMQHWLASILKKENHAMFEKLPPGYGWSKVY